MLPPDQLEPIRQVLRDRGHYHLAANDSLCEDLRRAIGAQQPWGYSSDRSDWDEYGSRKVFLRESQIKIGNPVPLHLTPPAPAAPTMIVGGMAYDD